MHEVDDDLLDRDINAAALIYHQEPVPGKIGIALTKPAETQWDLSLAYRPDAHGGMGIRRSPRA